MRLGTAVLLAMAAHAGPPGEEPFDLHTVARVASAIVDGDVCRRIQTPRSVGYLTKKDPRDRWVDGDNFDVDHPAFIATKKTLMRLARLCPEACDLNLWMPLPSDAKRVQILIRNVHEMSQFWSWGVLHQEMPPEMKRVMDTGERVTVTRRPGMRSVLTPVYDSLGDVAGIVEVVSQTGRDLRENVK